MRLAGKRVLILEARLPDVLADLIVRQGGDAVCVPAVVETEVPPDDVVTPLRSLCQRKVDVVVLQTGVGTQRLYRHAAAMNLGEAYLEALRHLPVAVRGPKPTAVLHRWGIRPTVAAPSPHTTAELCAALTAMTLSTRTVFVQHYGETNEPLREFLRSHGATTVDALPYRWALPEDPGPLHGAIEGLICGKFDAVLVTSQPQINHLFAVADVAGTATALREVLNARVAVAAVGPTSRRAIARHRVRVAVEPSQPKMAPLVQALAAHFDQAQPSHRG